MQQKIEKFALLFFFFFFFGTLRINFTKLACKFWTLETRSLINYKQEKLMKNQLGNVCLENFLHGACILCQEQGHGRCENAKYEA